MKSLDAQNKTSLLFTTIIILALVVFVFLYHFIQFRIEKRAGGSAATYLSFLSSQTTVSSESSPSFLPESLSGAGQIVLGRKIDLNTATAKDLEALPGIGPKMAESIIQDRDQRGPFRNLQDLMRIKGIKDKKLFEIRDFVTVTASKPPKP